MYRLILKACLVGIMMVVVMLATPFGEPHPVDAACPAGQGLDPNSNTCLPCSLQASFMVSFAGCNSSANAEEPPPPPPPPDLAAIVANDPGGDFDGDGTTNENDNCPGLSNPDQLDTYGFDNDSGDACTPVPYANDVTGVSIYQNKQGDVDFYSCRPDTPAGAPPQCDLVRVPTADGFDLDADLFDRICGPFNTSEECLSRIVRIYGDGNGNLVRETTTGPWQVRLYAISLISTPRQDGEGFEHRAIWQANVYYNGNLVDDNFRFVYSPLGGIIPID